MQNRSTFEYAIIRVVPKVEREEFFNVGVILFSKPLKYLDLKFHINQIKLKAFSEELEIDFLLENLKAWEYICAGDKEGGEIGKLDLPERFRWLTASRSTIIQCSKIHPGLSNDPEKCLNDLFNLYVS